MIFEFIFGILINILWFLSFSGKNDAESLWNFVKNLILNPKHAKLDQKSWFGHVRTCQVVICTCPDLPRPVQEDKYLLQTSGNTFIFSDFTPFHFLLANLSFFIKSNVFISKFIIFYKIRNSVSGPPKIFLIGSTRGVSVAQHNRYLLIFLIK